MKRYPFSEADFAALKGNGWEIRELPRSEWDKIPHLPRRDDLVAVFYSGCMNQEKILNGVKAVAGFDAIAHETKPKAGEPELNIYHAVIQKVDPEKNKMPFILHTPSADETLFGHWGGYEMFQKYLDKVAEQKAEPDTAKKPPVAEDHSQQTQPAPPSKAE